MKKELLFFLCIIFFSASQAQQISPDSLRRKYHIPEMAYAVVSSDSVLEWHVSGVQRQGLNYPAKENDLFRLGSNTKAVTALLACMLVEEKRISWKTRFFDLYPGLRDSSKQEYYRMTLEQLLNFKAPLVSWTYTNAQPEPGAFGSDIQQQRYRFVQWALRQEPAKKKNGVYFSNPSYCAAAMMLEKASGISYTQMLDSLGKKTGLRFYFGAPNTADTLQPYGHNAALVPELPQINEKLNWLGPAGNISMCTQDYARLMQLFLRGINGRSTLLPEKEFRKIFSDQKKFHLGWFPSGEKNDPYFRNIGNPGTFLSEAVIVPSKNRSYIIFCNVQSSEAEEGMRVLLGQLRSEYE